MFVKPCPKCGRQPKITEAVRGKDNVRRRFVGCPNYCSVLSSEPGEFFFRSFMIYLGDGDDNDIYKEWNRHLSTVKIAT